MGPDPFWTALFTPADKTADAVVTQGRILQKRGEPFLFLPQNKRRAARALALYPAQSRKARISKALFRLALSAGLALGTQPASIVVSRSDPFFKYLHDCAADDTAGFSVLAGNPRAEGRRFILLCFDTEDQPIAVIKAGTTQQARRLIAAESKFLKEAASESHPGVPGLTSTFEGELVHAFSTAFFAGTAPPATDRNNLCAILTAWLCTGQKIPFYKLSVWESLRNRVSQPGLLARLEEKLAMLRVSPALYHGDFAPWNIKVGAQGRWTVLDWERGQLHGPPGWDWLHYVIQPALLVEKLDTAGLVRRIETELKSGRFRAYAQAAGFQGAERDLVLAYLLHMQHVICPSEGLVQTESLIFALA